MIGTPATQTHAAVEAALRLHSPQLERIAAGRWHLSPSDGANGAAQARLEEGWLTLKLCLPDHDLTLWDALCLNREMQGLGKIVVSHDACTFEAAADIALTGLSDGALEQRLAEALADIAHAALRGAGRPSVSAGENAAERPAVDVAALVRESGWPMTIRPSGAAAVRLDVPGEFCQALVEHERRTAAVRLKADLGEAADLSAASREATALLMLTTSAVTRLARAYADRDAQGAPVGFEVAFSPPATPTEMGHALAALSVASRMCRRELAVVRDESVARDYLAVHGRGV
jgi:hypothetical protein